MAALSVCVYCGSRFGRDPAFAEAARGLGHAIGTRGWQLVYGGGNVGLMGVVADAVLAAGGRVVGVIPDSLMRREVGHSGLSELHVVQTMHERKQLMAERADAFVALPGGIGTLEELYEMWSWRHLGYHAKPIGLLNTAGFYDRLLTFMQQTVHDGFVYESQLAAVVVGTAPDDLLDLLAARSTPGSTTDYSRT
jgi:uncharacterized protein (TIGR00730 family)